jgi:hypothetical protein
MRLSKLKTTHIKTFFETANLGKIFKKCFRKSSPECCNFGASSTFQKNNYEFSKVAQLV